MGLISSMTKLSGCWASEGWSYLMGPSLPRHIPQGAFIARNRALCLRRRAPFALRGLLAIPALLLAWALPPAGKRKRARVSNAHFCAVTGSGSCSTGPLRCRFRVRFCRSGSKRWLSWLLYSSGFASPVGFSCMWDRQEIHPLQLAFYHDLSENSTLFCSFLLRITLFSSAKII